METIVIIVIAVIAIGAVAWPLVRGGHGARDAREYADTPVPDRPGTPAAGANAAVPGAAPAAEVGSELETEIARYRAAITAGTLCRRCGVANEAESRFCLECGAKLPVEDAQEFST